MFEELYEVSDMGLIRRIASARGIRPQWLFIPKIGHLGTDNYLYFNLWKKGALKRIGAHRIIAMAFIKNPKNKAEVNHKDGVKTNNRVSNLEWVTSKENNQHKIYVLNRGRGIDTGSKLNDKQVAEIKIRISLGQKNREIASYYSITPSNISCIRRGVTWSHINPARNAP